MKTQLFWFGIGGVLVTAMVVAREAPPAPSAAVVPAPPTRSTRFPQGSRNLDELVNRFLATLAGRDKAGMHALRVTEDEYRQVIVPGNVEPGEVPQETRNDVTDYFWGVLNAKSLLYELDLFERFGGRRLKLVRVDHSGEHTYAGFKSFRRIRLTMEDEQGSEVEIATGSVAQVDGHLKFISYIRD